jgi:uncharacterized protein involved in exopolysaccharide biosynthesis|tara:strand:+ start:759 stop:1697 length:939 start_codon:yes stop_codon:yes gene_type:complete
MKDKINENDMVMYDDEIDLKELFLVILNKKIFIGVVTSTALILSIIYSLSLSNIYTAQSLLAPVSQEDSLSSKLGNLSSIASLGGFSLPSDGGSKTQEAIERIRSFEFFSNYFLPNIKLENIIASKKWIPKDDILIYDKKAFNKSANKWIRKVSYPKKLTPSHQEAYKVYKELMYITEDKKTSFITISMDHHSPVIAKKWVDIIIYQINESMRKVDSDNAQKSISFLNKTVQSTNTQSLKEAIVKLLENQTQILMLANSNEYYVLKIIDSPIIQEEKSKPSRSLICALGALLGLILSTLTVLIQYYRKPSNA